MDSGILAVGTALVTGIFTWIAGSRNERAKIKKTSTETEGLHLGNVDKAVGIWEKLYDKLKIELDEVHEQVKVLIGENAKLHKEVLLLRDENSKLQKDVNKLTALVNQTQ